METKRIGIGFDFEDMASIAAACKAMAMAVAKNAKSGEDLLEALRLSRIALRIELAMNEERENANDDKEKS